MADQVDRLKLATEAALTAIGDPEPNLTAADLDGILDSVTAMRDALRKVMEEPPDADGLETVLINVNIEIEHLLWHWNEMAERLGQRLLLAAWAKIEAGL